MPIAVRDFGLTELFSESGEPPFTELPFDEFKQPFPGNRTFSEGGFTVEWAWVLQVRG
jgi:hypothetical protein